MNKNQDYAGWVINKMNETNLSMFKIIGLFDRYIVELPFNKEVNVFIGENGLGKTTILNCLYYVLTKKYTQLESIPFKTIEIAFRNMSHSIVINKADVVAYNMKRNGHRVWYDEDYFEFILSDFHVSADDLDDMTSEEFDSLAHRYANIQGVPMPMARKRFSRLLEMYRSQSKNRNMKGDERKIQALNRAINESFSERIIYLPTYRRIENDFSNLNLRNDELNDSELLIRFGMSDVQKYIDNILDQIRSLAVEGFNMMTGVLLGQYSENASISHRIKLLDLNIVKIVLDRLGDKIDSTTKQRIIKLIKTEEIYNLEYVHLINLLHKLCTSYDNQKHYDDRINGFVNTCNKYLNDKHFRYNPSNLTLGIYMNDYTEEQDTVKLTQLSSGEKQIVSLFSKLYLESDEKSIVIIDEPELSLSIRWQQMLLPDIIRSLNCKFLLTVTHSPFIFENEFDMDAREIRAYMQ